MNITKLNPFSNVVADGIAVMANIPMGEVYHGVMLKLGGTALTKAMLTKIQIRLGGKTIWDVTGSQLDAINQYMGMTANAAYLLIPFSDFNARTVFGEAIGAIDTSLDYSGFSMNVTIAGATAPTLEAWSMTTKNKVVQEAWHRPLFRVMVPNEYSYAAAGTFALDMPLGSTAGALIKRLHLFHTNITEFSVKMNGRDIQDEGENGLIQFLQNNLTRTTQAGHLAFDAVVLDNQSNAIPTTYVGDDGKTRESSFRFNATLSAADDFESISELYTDIQSL